MWIPVPHIRYTFEGTCLGSHTSVYPLLFPLLSLISTRLLTSVLQVNKTLWYAIQNNWIHNTTSFRRTNTSRLKHMFFQCNAESTKSQNNSNYIRQWWGLNLYSLSAVSKGMAPYLSQTIGQASETRGNPTKATFYKGGFPLCGAHIHHNTVWQFPRNNLQASNVLMDSIYLPTEEMKQSESFWYGGLMLKYSNRPSWGQAFACVRLPMRTLKQHLLARVMWRNSQAVCRVCANRQNSWSNPLESLRRVGCLWRMTGIHRTKAFLPCFLYLSHQM